jgi:hypothetical protein
MMLMTVCICWMRAAITSPNAVSVKASRNTSSTSTTTRRGDSDTSTSGASTSTRQACSVATAAPPSVLPIMIELRRTGATSISRRNPNSRSHTIDTAENIAVNSVEVARMPGNMKVRRSTPPVLPSVNDDRPVPSTNRNSTGCTSAERMRVRSWPKRISSRCSTTLIAR